MTPTGTVDFTVYTTRLTAPGRRRLRARMCRLWWCGASVVGCGCWCEWSVVQGALQRGRDLSDPSDGLCEPLTPEQAASSTATDIHAGAGANDRWCAAILSAAIGSTVHDSATVSGGVDVPTGTVDFTVYTNGLTARGVAGCGHGCAACGGVAHPSSTAVVGVNGLSFKAHYNGAATYDPSDGLCEPLSPDKLVADRRRDIHNANTIGLHGRRSVRRCMTRRR